MALKILEVEIGGWPMKITHVPAMESLDLWTQLIKQFGPALSQLGGGDDLEKILEGKVSDLNLGKVFETFCDDLDSKKMQDFVRKFSAHTTVKTGKNKWPDLSDQLDVVFSGNIDQMFVWLGLSLKHNYSSFLANGRLAGALASLQKLQAANGENQSQSPQE